MTNKPLTAVRQRAAFFLALLVLLPSCGRMRQERIPYLRELMEAMDSSACYQARKDSLVVSGKARLAAAQLMPGREAFDACMDVAALYSNYIGDSSIVYYMRARDIALTIGQDTLAYQAGASASRVLSVLGCFMEAAQLLDEIPSGQRKGSVASLYYRGRSDLFHSLYLSLGADSPFYDAFVQKFELNRDSLLAVLPPDSFVSLREQERKAARAGDYDEALAFNDRRLERAPESAGVLYDRYTIYRYYMKRPSADHVEYLFRSSLADIRSFNQNMASLRYMEEYLLDCGAVSEAKKVSDYYYKTMQTFGSRTRLLAALGVNMRVNDEYSTTLSRRTRLLQYALLLIAAMMAVLLLVLRQMNMSRRRIERLNRELDRSGKAARGYVLGFFNLYSSYLSRLQNLRSKINVNIRRGNTDLILSLTDPTRDFSGEELKQLYANFDRAFLDIFPNFIDEVNAMLLPEARFTNCPPGGLNSDLRILAIIKLGISDSARISELLHCSIKTVYNKRSEMNTRLQVSREEFLRKLSDI